MALLHTPTRNAAFQALDFTLKNIDGNMISMKDIMGSHGMLIMFICNHCPYVKAITGRLTDTCRRLQEEGIGCAAIMANDTEHYPEDSFDNMIRFARENGFTFPYLIDETQGVARAYDAVCTPDFFGFDKNGMLQYRGRLDSAAGRPADTATVPELFNAMIQVKNTGHGPEKQTPSMGCSIKWK